MSRAAGALGVCPTPIGRVQSKDNITKGSWIRQEIMSPYSAFSFLDYEWKS